MSDSFRKKADQVVATFREHLGNSQIEISNNDYEVLSNLIAAAIADELSETADDIGAIVTRIHKAIEKPDLAL